ncbi:recombinase family protein [Kitasatospora sp. NPDC004289]
MAVNVRSAVRRALIYIRVSTARVEMISPELQEFQCRELVTRESMPLVREPLVDLGKSGRAFSDRQIAQIIALAEAGAFDVLVLWVWSRFGRNTLESLKNLERLTELGIEVRAAKEDFDGRTVIGRFAIRQMLTPPPTDESSHRTQLTSPRPQDPVTSSNRLALPVSGSPCRP